MKQISILTGLLTLTVALFSFTVSFVSLQTLAQDFKFPIPFLFPLIIEASVIIFSLNALYRYLNQSKTGWQWTLVIFSSILALCFNVFHALDGEPQINLTKAIMFGLPSLFFLLAFESFLSQIQHITKKRLDFQNASNEVDSLLTLKRKELSSLETDLNEAQGNLKNLLDEISKQREDYQTEVKKGLETLENLTSKIENGKAELKQIRSEVKEESKELESNKARLNIVLESIKGGNLKINDIAKEFEVSSQTIYNDIRKLEVSGLIHKNGKGWVVND